MNITLNNHSDFSDNKIILEEVSITFLGGAGTVTGSNILLRTLRYHILIDYGLLHWLKKIKSPVRNVFLNHGEPSQSNSLGLKVRALSSGSVQ